MMKSGVVLRWFVVLVMIAVATTSGYRHSSFGFMTSFFYHNSFSVIVLGAMKLLPLVVVIPRVMGIVSPDLWSSTVIMA
jgi:hypothetical protein